MSFKARLFILPVAFLAVWFFASPIQTHAQVTNPQTGSIGLQGTIPTEPPKVGATISFPTNGQVFREIPITVQGICPIDLLVKIFKNQVFAGAVPCEPDGTFSIDIDLFSGKNQIVARVFDSLDQPGPDSNVVTISYNNAPEDTEIAQLILTSNFALRGADAGTKLIWPLAVSGGVRPYAISVDWGDGENSQLALDLGGNFEVDHIYFEPGVYKVVVRAGDGRGKSAFIQLVAVANGPSSQINTAGSGIDSEVASTISRSFVIPLWPIYLMFFFVISTFWLGRRYELQRIKNAVKRGKAVQL
jgi:hypothetical protein